MEVEKSIFLRFYKNSNNLTIIVCFFLLVLSFNVYANQPVACDELYNKLVHHNKENSDSSLVIARKLEACLEANQTDNAKMYEYTFEIGLAYKNNHNVDTAFIIFDHLLAKNDVSARLSLTILNEIIDIQYQKSNFNEYKKYTLRQLKLAEQAEDTMYVAEALFNLGYAYQYYAQWDSAEYMYRKAMDISLTYGDTSKYNRIKLSFASFISVKEGPYPALKLFKEIEAFAEAANETSLLSDTYFFLGITHRKIGREDEAIIYYNKVIPLYMADKRFDRLPKLYGNLGLLYKLIENYERALDSYLKALSYTQEYDDNLRCGLHVLIGSIYIDMEDYEKGFSYLKVGNTICLKIENNVRIAECYFAMAKYYHHRPFANKKKDYDSVLHYYSKSFDIYQLIKNKSGQVKALGGMAQMYLLKDDTKKAEKILLDGLTIAKEEASQENEGYILSLLTQLYRQTGEYQKADAFNVLHQDILNLEHKTKLNKQLNDNLAYFDYLLSVKQDSLQHEHRLNLQKALIQEKDKALLRQSSAIVVITVTLVVLIIFIFIISNRNRELHLARKEIAKQKEQVELQHKKLSDAYATLRATQSKLLEKDKLAVIGSLTQNMAHELKNPFHFVKGSAMAVKDVWCKSNNVTDAKLFTFLNGIEEGVNRMDRIIKSLYRFDRQSIENERVDLHQIVDECFSLVIHEYKKSVTLQNALLKPTYHKINNDAIHIIITNIFKNSLEAIERKGVISVSSETVDDSLIVKIADDGKGVPDDILEHIFEPFYSTKQNVSGVGIGLFHVYNLMNDIDSDIKIHSTINKGTVVSLIFKNHAS